MGTKNNPGKFDCYANAHPDEPMFILLGRDPVAWCLVELWASIRRELGQSLTEPQIEEAATCQRAMKDWAESHGKGDQARDAASAMLAVFRKYLESVEN